LSPELPDCEAGRDWVKVLTTKEYWLFLGYWFLGNASKFLPDHTTLSKKWQLSSSVTQFLDENTKPAVGFAILVEKKKLRATITILW